MKTMPGVPHPSAIRRLTYLLPAAGDQRLSGAVIMRLCEPGKWWGEGVGGVCF